MGEERPSARPAEGLSGALYPFHAKEPALAGNPPGTRLPVQHNAPIIPSI